MQLLGLPSEFLMIDKARSAKHVSSISLNKFCTTTIRKEKVPQKQKPFIIVS